MKVLAWLASPYVCLVIIANQNVQIIKIKSYQCRGSKNLLVFPPLTLSQNFQTWVLKGWLEPYYYFPLIFWTICIVFSNNFSLFLWTFRYFIIVSRADSSFQFKSFFWPFSRSNDISMLLVCCFGIREEEELKIWCPIN